MQNNPGIFSKALRLYSECTVGCCESWQDNESGVPSGKAVGATQRLEAHWKFAAKAAGLLTAQVLMPKFKMAAEVILQHDLSFNAFLTVFMVTTFDLMTFVPAFAVQTATWIWLNRLSD